MITEQLHKIYHIAKEIKIKPIAKISALLNIHRDTVKRRLKTLRSREHHPCSCAFETSQGQQWLQLLVVLTIFYFGIKSNVGSNVIFEFLFLTMLGVGLYLGISAGSVKRIEQGMDQVISQFGEQQNETLLPLAQKIDIHAGDDETFFEQYNVLVFMDLVSGFIIKEEVQEKRTFEIWEKTVLKCTTYFKSFKSLVSDGSNVLKKLSNVTLSSIHFSDLFHLLHYVSSVMRFQFPTKIKSLDKQINKEENEAVLAELNKNRQCLVDGQKAFKQALCDISLAVNPFSMDQSIAVTSIDVMKILKNSASTLEAIKNNCALSDKKNKLTTFKNQLPGASSQIDEWWC